MKLKHYPGLILKRIISGGQSGADHGALVAAKILGLETGGWMPKGFRTDDGPKPQYRDKFNMIEHSSVEYRDRTKTNVLASDATFIFGNIRSRGSALTVKYAKAYQKPIYSYPWRSGDAIPSADPIFVDWLITYRIDLLNVAGNRERLQLGIYEAIIQYLTRSLGEIE